MAEEFGMLAHHYPNREHEFGGWLISRKYNGNAFLWDGGVTRGMLAKDVPWYYKGKDKDEKATGFWSLGRVKDGIQRVKVIHAPDFIVHQLPLGMPLQGEIWAEDCLEQVGSLCRSKSPYSSAWLKAVLVVYNYKPYSLWRGVKELGVGIDESSPFWANKMFRDRLVDIQTRVMESSNVVIADQVPLVVGQLNQFIETAINNGWEGLMLANPNARYELKRSHNLLKVKQKYETEAEVIGYEDGKTGSRIGTTGAIFVRLTWDDKVLSVPGGKAEFIGKTVESKCSGLNLDEAHAVETFYPVGSKVRVSFSCVSTYGIMSSCNIYRGM